MISPGAIAIAVASFLWGNHGHLKSYGQSDPGEALDRIAGRHETRAHEKTRRRMRKASQRYNRNH